MNRKVAIITSGGGMTCSYSAGFLSALAKEHGLKSPDLVIAGSGSSGAMSYYVAGQYDSFINIWANLLSTKKFINPLRFWRIMDIGYLIDTVFKKQEPLKTRAIYLSKITYLIPATNYRTGKIHYFSNRDRDNIFEAMRATMAMPIISNKRVVVKGANYIDAHLSSSAYPHVLKALELGATHIIVVSNNNPRLVARIGYNCWLLSRNATFRRNYHELEEKIKEPNIFGAAKVLTITPSTKLKISGLNNSEELLSKTIDLGYRDCKHNQRLKDFLKEFISY